MKRMLLLSALTFVLTGCTLQQAAQVAFNKDPEAALKRLGEYKLEQYKQNPEQFLDDIKRVKEDYNRLMMKLKETTGKQWGKKEAEEVPTQTKYVKYTQNYKSRSMVDFDSGSVVVETLDDKNTEESLRNAIATTLLTPNDPRSVDMFSDKPVELKGTPYMKGLVIDQNNKPVNTLEDAERYANYLAKNKAQTREINTESGVKKVNYVKIDMVNNHADKRAAQYDDIVTRHAASTNMSKSLVFAVIKTESNFNPFAVSSAPAYGMMQLVPTSGGREAYRKVKGNDVPPTKEYLFDADNNIELGSTYLSVLTYTHLKMIEDSVSREYCVIAAYNTGPGNVLKTFSKNRKEAVDIINSMNPQEVFERLRSSLPYEETRGYIVKVTGARKTFAKTQTN